MKTTFSLILISLAGSLFAQQPVQQIRLTDCISQALGKNPSLEISQAKVQAAEARSSETATACCRSLSSAEEQPN